MTDERNTKTVLIVEDDHDIAHVLELRVKASGFRTAVAYDATLATQVARQVQPDLALLDISMPGGTGFDVADRLRRVIGADIPLIFITASKRVELRERAANYDPVAYFEKPYPPDELISAIGAAL